MLNNKSVIVNAVFLPANVRKSYAGINTTVAFKRVISADVQSTDSCPPRSLSGNVESARAGMGAGVTPVSFVSGLTFIVSAFAFGQIGKPEDIAKGMPAHAVHAVTVACAMVKRGAGINRATLESVVVSGIDSMLALPSKEKAKQASVSTPLVITAGATVAGECIRVVDGLTDAEIQASHISANKADKADDSILASMIAHVSTLAESESTARATVQAKAENEGENVAKIVCSMKNTDQAINLIRAMAAHYGFTLTSLELPVKIAA